MYNEVITFKKRTILADGTQKTVSRKVFCRITSIGTSEFYQAYSAGLKPDIKFILADYLLYKDEDRLTYKGADYQVLRAYRNGSELELTCQAIIGGGY